MTKEWQPKQDKLMAEAIRKLAEFEANHPATSDLDLVGINYISVWTRDPGKGFLEVGVGLECNVNITNARVI